MYASCLSNRGKEFGVIQTTVFKCLQVTTILVFLVFISDVRTKRRMIPLMTRRVVIGIRLWYPMILGTYGYAVGTLHRLFAYDWIALAITSLATALVVKAKLDLAGQHTWAGFFLEGPQLTIRGAYSWIRHPLYTGIYMFALGGGGTIVLHERAGITAVTCLGLLCIMAFLAAAARREDQALERQLGDEFLQYKTRVHAFLPIRKWRGREIITTGATTKTPAERRWQH